MKVVVMLEEVKNASKNGLESAIKRSSMMLLNFHFQTLYLKPGERGYGHVIYIARNLNFMFWML
jgi:hypothetical protein